MSLLNRWIAAAKSGRRSRNHRAELSSLSLENLESRALLSGNVFTKFGHAVTKEFHKVVGTDKPHHHVFGIDIHSDHSHHHASHKV